MNSIVCLYDGINIFEGIAVNAKNAYMAAKKAARFYRRLYPLFNKTTQKERLKRAGGKNCHVYGIQAGFYLIVMPSDIISKTGTAEGDKLATMNMAQSIYYHGYKTMTGKGTN